MSMIWQFASVLARSFMNNYQIGERVKHTETGKIYEISGGTLSDHTGLVNVWICKPVLENNEFGEPVRISGHFLKYQKTS